MKPPNQASNDQTSPEPWITKRRLAEHLSVTTRWIELQQRRGLPHIHTPVSTAIASRKSRPGCASSTAGRKSSRRFLPRWPASPATIELFAPVRGCSQTYGKSGRTVRVGFPKRFLGRLRSRLRSSCHVHTGLRAHRDPVYAMLNKRMLRWRDFPASTAGQVAEAKGVEPSFVTSYPQIEIRP
jgi:hypothetical protein